MRQPLKVLEPALDFIADIGGESPFGKRPGGNRVGHAREMHLNARRLAARGMRRHPSSGLGNKVEDTFDVLACAQLGNFKVSASAGIHPAIKVPDFNHITASGAGVNTKGTEYPKFRLQLLEFIDFNNSLSNADA